MVTLTAHSSNKRRGGYHHHSSLNGGGGGGFSLSSWGQQLHKRRFWMLLLLPTFLAVATMVGRFWEHHAHSSMSIPAWEETVARLASTTETDKKEGGSDEVPRLLKSSDEASPTLRSNRHVKNKNHKDIPNKKKTFFLQPTRRDLNVLILDDPRGGIVNVPSKNSRALAAPDASQCALPSDTCDFVYAALASSNRLSKIHVATGQAVDVGATGFNLTAGMAFDSTTQTLFGNDGTNLVTIDPCTGQGTVVGPTGMTTDSLAIDSKGDVYAWAQMYLVKINKSTGAATAVNASATVLAGAHNLAFDDCGVLHMVDESQTHYTINVTTGVAQLSDRVQDGNVFDDYVQGDIIPGTKRMVSSQIRGSKGSGLHIIDLEENKEKDFIFTDDYYVSTAFTCDLPSYPDYSFSSHNNATAETNNMTGPKTFKLYVGPTGKVPKNKPDPDRDLKPRTECDQVLQQLKTVVQGYSPPFDTGDAVVRYECPNNLNMSIPFVYFMHVRVEISGPGKETRVQLKVYQHPEDGSPPVLMAYPSPVVHQNGLVFFVPLQKGNHTVQLLDGTGIPIQDSAECEHSELKVSLHPYEQPEEPEDATEAPTSAPTDFTDTLMNQECPLNNKTMEAECDKEGSNTWGDPHLISFDGTKFDCQTRGDHVIAKSRNTNFEIQARYGKPYFRPQFLAWMIGVAIQEGSWDVPKVEISLDTPFRSEDGSVQSTCDKTILVDGVKVTGDITLPTATGTNRVWFRQSRNKRNELVISVNYWSGLVVQVTERSRSTFGCSLTTDIKVPLYMREEWDLYGLMGSPDGIRSNDWVEPDGTQIGIPGNGKRKVNAMQSVAYCRKWCQKNQEKSLFDYTDATRHSFSDWQHCDSGPKLASEDEWLKFMKEVNDNNPEIIIACAEAASDQAAKGNLRFDQQDCVVELVGGATIEDVIADQAALMEGDLQSTGIVYCGDRTKTDCQNLYGSNKLLKRKSTKHSIACCVDVETWGPVIGASAVNTTTGQCLGEGNYNEAYAACAAVPKGRLCSEEEVNDLILQGTQCDVSKKMVWTDSLPSGKIEVHQWKACGTKNGCGGQRNQLVDASKSTEKAKVRCCSSHAITGWKGPKCDLWSQSDFNGECSGDMTFDDAVKFCLVRGGYMCSKEDLENDCTQGSGCGYDGQQVWAMDTGVVETPLPLAENPFAHLDKEQKRWLACGDKTILGCMRDEGAFEIVAAESELHEVRCCKESTTDLSADGWIQQEDEQCQGIWAKAKVSSVGDGCVHSASFASAEGYCNSVGGVVCKKEWVVKGCTKALGCAHDPDLVWTSDIVDESSINPVKMSWVACGSNDHCRQSYGKGAQLRPKETRHEVRCCSDSYKPGWLMNKQYGCTVWAESDVPICYHAETWDDAREICDIAGARLCTKNELIANCAAHSGCHHDWDFVWSLDRGWEVVVEPQPDPRIAEDKYWLACGNVDKSTCVQVEGTNEHLAAESEEHEFVCCSDDDTLGAPWAVENSNTCNVHATAKLDGSCLGSSTYADAKQKCSASGGRLCTRKELLGRCARTVAKSCGLEGHLLWTSEGHDESTQGALQEMRWLSCGRKGACTELHGKGGRMEDHTGPHDHEVRCCSDYPMAGWMKKDGCPWTESDINGVCIHANTYDEAVKSCTDAGARLCEKDELLRQCTSGSGCMHDLDLIWSATPAFLPKTEVVDEVKAYLACGNADKGKCVKFEGTKEAISSSLDKHEVRCCSDVQFDSTWMNDASNAKCSNVFAKSNVPVCYHDATYQEAQDICSKYTDDSGNSGRLCTKQEVLDGCADNSGSCGHDDDLVWTADDLIWSNDTINTQTVALVEKKWTVCGKRGACDTGAELVDHTDNTALAAVRCCASHYVAGWHDPGSDCPGVWSSGDRVNGQCNFVPYHEAESICSAYGARLCTKSEIVSDCTKKGAACGYNSLMVWSKESGYEIAPTTIKAQ